ncbi:MAG: hypothetical protein WCI51_00860 [Lentisphaerota bacterium]
MNEEGKNKDAVTEVDENADQEILQAVKWWTENKKKWSKWISAGIAAVTAIVTILSYVASGVSSFGEFKAQLSGYMRDVVHIADVQKQQVETMQQHSRENREDFKALQRDVAATREDMAEIKSLFKTSRMTNETAIGETFKLSQKEKRL